jgi:hypothetical protein
MRLLPRPGGQSDFPAEARLGPPDAAEESLVADPRAGLTPADLVEHKLRGGMNGAPVRFSQLFTGLRGARGPTRGPGPTPGNVTCVGVAEGEARDEVPAPAAEKGPKEASHADRARR